VNQDLEKIVCNWPVIKKIHTNEKTNNHVNHNSGLIAQNYNIQRNLPVVYVMNFSPGNLLIFSFVKIIFFKIANFMKRPNNFNGVYVNPQFQMIPNYIPCYNPYNMVYPSNNKEFVLEEFSSTTDGSNDKNNKINGSCKNSYTNNSIIERKNEDPIDKYFDF